MPPPDPPSLSIFHASHLAWDARLFQRPQQLASQFAAMGDRVTYFAPVGWARWRAMGAAARDVALANGGRALACPWYARPEGGGTQSRLALGAARRAMAAVLGGSGATHRRVLWLQNPAFLELLDARGMFDVSVYDCMDPFAQFAGSAPSPVETREADLLRRADFVFAGGRSLHAHCARIRPDARCFPSGIDFAHFARAADAGPVPPEIASLPKPVLGYFGAVDERIDWALVQALCDARPGWSIVFVGPLVGLAAAPIRASNFHFLGPRSYAELPDCLRGFDACLIPWVVNDLTRSMSPTKTPEYLASGRPVVSVPIPDVVSDYGGEVGMGASAGEFIAACDAALARGAGEPRKPSCARTWQEIAREMRGLLAGD